MNLKEISIGTPCTVVRLGGNGELRQHFLDMGIIPGAQVKKIKTAPMGDPVEFEVNGYELTMRCADAEKILVKAAAQTAVPQDNLKEETLKPSENKSFHPGLGEDGKFHAKGEGSPLPEGTVMKFVLVGNQNSGKTTLFNQLTGSNQHTGNFPGVTVSRKDGQIKNHPDTLVTDLPGIYSMSPYSSEELISRDVVLNEKPHGIINIVDATNIERNLYLTMQLLEMDLPMVVALNMMDEVTGNGGTVDVNLLEEFLGVPVVPVSAAKNQGVQELVKHALHVAHFQEKPLRKDFCDENENGGAVHRALHAVIHLIQDHARNAGIPVRFAASKLLEDDKLIVHSLNIDLNEKETLEHIAIQMEKERGLDRSAAIADMRYSFIRKICALAVKKPRQSRERIRSEKIDSVITGRYTAIPVFIGIMALVFFLTFNVIGAFFQELLDDGITALTSVIDEGLTALNTNEVLHGLVTEGICAGVGSVISFLPIIVTLFFFLSILEDSGYIARVAFVMDNLLRKIGLSGRSIVPLLIGFGCTVPAVMATRTLPSERDRKMTILLTPFMSCTAKVPVYAFFVSAFFPGHGALAMTSLYLLGIAAGIIISFLYRKTLFRGEPVPFVMELPNYRLPGLRNVVLLLWDKARDFLQRAFTIIFLATIAVWFLQSFDVHLNYVSDSSQSILSSIAGAFAPLFSVLGFGDWKICTALITGIIAKESVVSTLEVLYSGGAVSFLSQGAAVCLLVFSLIYTPCVAAVASIKRELGAKWAAGVAVWHFAAAWIFAFAARLILNAFGIE